MRKRRQREGKFEKESIERKWKEQENESEKVYLKRKQKNGLERRKKEGRKIRLAIQKIKVTKKIGKKVEKNRTYE